MNENFNILGFFNGDRTYSCVVLEEMPIDDRFVLYEWDDPISVSKIVVKGQPHPFIESFLDGATQLLVSMESYTSDNTTFDDTGFRVLKTFEGWSIGDVITLKYKPAITFKYLAFRKFDKTGELQLSVCYVGLFA